MLLRQVRPAPWILWVVRREPDGGRVNFWRDRRPAGQSQKEGKDSASVASSQRKQGISP
ncbi:hypothetical protein [Klebsiella pneumoniae]|uniref:hypothetical protein n=1 Tax=Klebsiella pneumoniae TaxID=573 RepID=UPI003AB7802A